MRGGVEIDWRRLADGTLSYEMPWPALDDERFRRIVSGFGTHYEVEWLSPDGFAFRRGEGYTRLERWDAFGYVDGGTVERLRAGTAELDEPADNIVVLPAGYRAIRFTLNMRVIIIFWLVLLVCAKLALFDRSSWLPWAGGFAAIYALHVGLVIRSLKRKLTTWLARSSWN